MNSFILSCFEEAQNKKVVYDIGLQRCRTIGPIQNNNWVMKTENCIALKMDSCSM